jgi:nucleoid DNA-binding protein
MASGDGHVAMVNTTTAEEGRNALTRAAHRGTGSANKAHTTGDAAQMNRTELAEALAAESTLSKKDAEATLVSAFKLIGAAMARGEDVNIAGFGIFTVVDTPERDGRNPQTGATCSKQ